MSRIYIWLIMSLLLITSLVVYGQDIKPENLCPARTVTVTAGSGGIIKHTQGPSCILTLVGLSRGAHVGIVGVRKLVGRTCKKIISIDGTEYCPTAAEVVFVQLSGTIMAMSSPSSSSNFTIEYYSNVAKCGQQITLTSAPQVSLLYGIISSSLLLRVKSSDTCATTISRLPASIVKFEILKEDGVFSEDHKLSAGGQKFTSSSDTLLVTPVSNQIDVRYIPNDDKSNMLFIIRFTVLHCGDIPSISRTTNSSFPQPWFPGTRITYSCVDANYVMKNTSSIECEVAGAETSWSDTLQIKCIPVPWCLSTPPTVEHATPILSGDKKKATYQCDTGYSTNTTDFVSVCYSSDADTVHWIWRALHAHCKPVECQVPVGFLPIANGSVTSGGDNGKYYYNALLTYQCDTGFNKAVEIIQCQSDGSWSATPRCDAVECKLGLEFNEISNGVSTSERSYFYTDIFRYDCDSGYNRSVDIILCQGNGIWSAVPACTCECSTTTTFATRTTKLPASSGLSGQTIALISGGAGLVALAIVVVVVVCICIRRKKPDDSSKSGLDNAGSTDFAEYGEASPYHVSRQPAVVTDHVVYEQGNGSEGAYSSVRISTGTPVAAQGKKPKIKKKPTKSEPPNLDDEANAQSDQVYAAIAPKKGRSVTAAASQDLYPSNELLYEEAPAPAPKLDPVVFENNELYESSGAWSQQPRRENDGEVDMVDNELYDSTTR